MSDRQPKSRGQKQITKLSPGVDWLYDKLYDEHVEVVEINTGSVRLRYPHQTEVEFWRCACEDIVEGMRGLEEHAQDCEEANEEWFEKVSEDATNDPESDWFERYDHPAHIESYSYSWPLDGRRFTVSTGPE